MRKKTLFLNFRCKFRHRRSIRRPLFPVKVQNFGDLAKFSVDFCILYARISTVFLPPICLTYWPRKYTTRVDPTSIILTKLEVDMTIHCRDIAFLSADTSRDCDLHLWPFHLEQLEYMAGHVTNLATNMPPNLKTYAYPFMSYEL